VPLSATLLFLYEAYLEGMETAGSLSGRIKIELYEAYLEGMETWFFC
jgi:hypothetical protein